jgi:polar amino acid transport system permease protein
MNYVWNFSAVVPYFPSLLRGLVYSLELNTISVGAGLVFSMVIFAARTSKSAVARWIATAFIEVFRGLPVLAAMVWLFYVLPTAFGGLPGPAGVACIALGANYAALQAENIRSGAEAIPGEQIATARSLGVGRFTELTRIVLPQAFLRSLPAALNQAVNSFKLTSLASFLSVHELFFTSSDVIQASLRPLEVYTLMAALYLGAVALGMILVKLVQWRLLSRFGLAWPG